MKLIEQNICGHPEKHQDRLKNIANEKLNLMKTIKIFQ